MIGSLRHLRIFLALAEAGSVTRAADLCGVTQPAVTQAIAKLERNLENTFFQRSSRGFYLTPAGEILQNRIARAFSILDPALTEVAPRLKLVVTPAQLKALTAVVEAESFTQAALRLGLAQPTVHRAVRQIENEAGYELFDRTSHGVIPKRLARALAIATRLAMAEFEQAQADLGEQQGREVGQVVIGAMPLSRSALLGQAIARFRNIYPTLLVSAVEGPYQDLALGLRRGEIDFLVGALRPDTDSSEFFQEALFKDDMAVVARPGHPLLSEPVDITAMSRQAWVVSPPGTPARGFFDEIFGKGAGGEKSLVQTGSMILMRELLRLTDHLGFISSRQVQPEIDAGLLAQLPWRSAFCSRAIGLTTRLGWQPTKAQSAIMDAIRDAVPSESTPSKLS